ncbi:MAG: imidazole glycerol phosphate synthase subunit HisH [Candidatus Omnitrophica bacterium]|nr:imidazole glycerol phosphate synthase subunit HisH [Candidatus Omnitrophota bacterium]MCM8823647.1 imidazole glycerol phosphate synthase subunit HisH [Candidatus Omnitrophota bacterium]MCM8825955.1 imidazole glycerol phosphate synthase subunit HisH [Candidatus Omnitrophota bacterium]
MIVIIDYGMGNLRSVSKAIAHWDVSYVVTDSPLVIKRAKKIILPGVGHFGKAVRELKKRKIFNLIKDKVREGVPFLGICLGMQLLFKRSEEALQVKGLGLIEGEVKRFSKKGLVVPHMGWNRVTIESNREKLFKDIKNNSFFYFAHSYYCLPYQKEVILGFTNYGIEFVSSLNKGNIWAVQFHPEKSQELGLKVCRNFIFEC